MYTNSTGCDLVDLQYVVFIVRLPWDGSGETVALMQDLLLLQRWCGVSAAKMWVPSTTLETQNCFSSLLLLSHSLRNKFCLKATLHLSSALTIPLKPPLEVNDFLNTMSI